MLSPVAFHTYRLPVCRPQSSTALLSKSPRSHACAAYKHARDFWGYPSSNVRSIEVDSFRLMHRASFSHRNLRTYVVVVYAPGSTRCADIEGEIERLATGLSHERRVVVAGLNVLGSKDAFTFCTSVLETKQYPTVYLYPEGTPGYMRFTGSEVTAESLLSALNGCQKRVFGNRQPLELIGTPLPLEATPLAPEEVVLQRPQQQQQQQQGGRGRQQQQQVAVVQQLTAEQQGYWTPGKAALWGGVLLFSIGAFWWDQWGEDWWDLRQLRDRQRRRQRGEEFDADTNADDLLQLSLMGAMSVEQAVARVSEEEKAAMMGLNASGAPLGMNPQGKEMRTLDSRAENGSQAL